MTTAIEPKLENPKNDLNAKPLVDDDCLSKHTPASSGGGGEEPNDELAAAARTSDTHESGAVTDIQKKVKRAERFGMPVQITEEEKRNSRAERFDTGSAANGSDTCKASEELKRKTRAERFGIVQSDPSGEEAKKKARLARFGGSLSKTELMEEDKKKARATRFLQPDSISGSKTNGKENIEVKTDTAGKASG